MKDWPILILRIEAFFVFIGSLYLYSKFSFPWSSFFIYFLVPDLSFAGYLMSQKLGALIYNMAHSYILPLFLGILAIYTTDVELQKFSLIWISHIGLDRTLGFGLKYTRGFKYTHLGDLNINFFK